MITLHHTHHLRCNDHLKCDSNEPTICEGFFFICYLMPWTLATGHASNETHNYVIPVFSVHCPHTHTHIECSNYYYYLNSNPARNYVVSVLWYVSFSRIILLVGPMSFSVVSFTMSYISRSMFSVLSLQNRASKTSEKLKMQVKCCDGDTDWKHRIVDTFYVSIVWVDCSDWWHFYSCGWITANNCNAIFLVN